MNRQLILLFTIALCIGVLSLFYAANCDTGWVVKEVSDHAVVYQRRVSDSLFTSHWQTKEVFCQ